MGTIPFLVTQTPDRISTERGRDISKDPYHPTFLPFSFGGAKSADRTKLAENHESKDSHYPFSRTNPCLGLRYYPWNVPQKQWTDVAETWSKTNLTFCGPSFLIPDWDGKWRGEKMIDGSPQSRVVTRTRKIAEIGPHRKKSIITSITREMRFSRER